MGGGRARELVRLWSPTEPPPPWPSPTRGEGIIRCHAPAICCYLNGIDPHAAIGMGRAPVPVAFLSKSMNHTRGPRNEGSLADE